MVSTRKNRGIKGGRLSRTMRGGSKNKRKSLKKKNPHKKKKGSKHVKSKKKGKTNLFIYLKLIISLLKNYLVYRTSI